MTSALNYDIEVVRGAIKGVANYSLFGRSAELTQDITEDVWINGGTYVFPDDDGETMTIVFF